MNKNKKSIYRRGEEEKSITDKYAHNLKEIGQQLIPILNTYQKKIKKYINVENIKNVYYSLIGLVIMGVFFWGFFAFFGYILRNWGK